MKRFLWSLYLHDMINKNKEGYIRNFEFYDDSFEVLFIKTVPEFIKDQIDTHHDPNKVINSDVSDIMCGAGIDREIMT